MKGGTTNRCLNVNFDWKKWYCKLSDVFCYLHHWHFLARDRHPDTDRALTSIEATTVVITTSLNNNGHWHRNVPLHCSVPTKAPLHRSIDSNDDVDDDDDDDDDGDNNNCSYTCNRVSYKLNKRLRMLIRFGWFSGYSLLYVRQATLLLLIENTTNRTTFFVGLAQAHCACAWVKRLNLDLELDLSHKIPPSLLLSFNVGR